MARNGRDLERVAKTPIAELSLLALASLALVSCGGQASGNEGQTQQTPNTAAASAPAPNQVSMVLECAKGGIAGLLVNRSSNPQPGDKTAVFEFTCVNGDHLGPNAPVPQVPVHGVVHFKPTDAIVAATCTDNVEPTMTSDTSGDTTSVTVACSNGTEFARVIIQAIDGLYDATPTPATN